MTPSTPILRVPAWAGPAPNRAAPTARAAADAAVAEMVRNVFIMTLLVD